MFELGSAGDTGELLRLAGWTTLTGVNLMLFSLLHNPCSTTLYTIYQETKSWRWTALSAAPSSGSGFWRHLPRCPDLEVGGLRQPTYRPHGEPPMSPLERETKLTVSARDYSVLREAGRLLERRDQLNIYLHDPDRLMDHPLGHSGYFRVRFESDREPVASLKIPVGWRGEMREMIEVERPLSDLGPVFFLGLGAG